ncbi:MAG: hypothetical protein V1726_06235 [Methanobacteriota archaeon]
MNYYRVCKICRHQLQQIPVRRLDPIIVVEHYCPHCDTSETSYENVDTL